MKMNDKLSDIFDMEVVDENNQPIVPVKEIEDIKENKVEEDFEEARQNLKELLEQGRDALYHAIELAKSGENARSFEVVGLMTKQLADINQQLMDLHLQKSKIENSNNQETKETTNNIQQNNAIFVGSSTEMKKMLQDLRKGV